MLEKTWKKAAFNYLQHMENPRIEKSGETHGRSHRQQADGRDDRRKDML